ncbi:MAG TPA: S53 family peptidase [Steroidobacteraceae bacterium]
MIRTRSVRAAAMLGTATLILVGLSFAGLSLEGARRAIAPGRSESPGLHLGMRPYVRIGSQVKPTGLRPGGVGPQYGLFSCQYGQSVATCYDPYEMRHAYGVDALIGGGYDGVGQTIVIVDAFQNPNIQAQLSDFDAYYGLPDLHVSIVHPLGLTAFVPGNPTMTGWAEEISLDVEWAHAIAPGAQIVLLLAPDDSDASLVGVLQYAVEHNLGDVISMSFGENESCVDPQTQSAWHSALASATAKHITLLASSGDQGAAQLSCDGTTWVQAVSAPASDPLVTSVGGTELHAAGYCFASLGCNPSTNPSPGTYQGEIAWNEGPPFGDFQGGFASSMASGGGFSVVFDEPPYQKRGVKAKKQRALPDVAYNAAVYHGVITYLDVPGLAAGFYLFGGTSAGAPQWAAIIAIANQRAGGRLGFLSTAIYHVGQMKQSYSTAFHDVRAGNNSVVEYDYLAKPVTIGGFSAAAEWDATTGNGSPAAADLVDDLIRWVSPGDATAVLANTKPKAHPKPAKPGKVKPH